MRTGANYSCFQSCSAAILSMIDRSLPANLQVLEQSTAITLCMDELMFHLQYYLNNLVGEIQSSFDFMCHNYGIIIYR